jgi:hypothetical protein
MAKELKSINVKCQGISPLLMNPMTDEILEGLRTGVHTKIEKDAPAKKVAEKKIYKDEDGNIGIPALNLYSALMEAGRHEKLGKKQISTTKSSLLPSFLWIEGEFLQFTNGTEWEVDKRRGVMDSGGKKTAVCIVRPKFKDWEFTVNLTLDPNICDESLAKKLLIIAGNMIGLGDFRPTCRGPFGRFKVIEWNSKKI